MPTTRRHGLSLLELLAVLGVIAAIALAVIPRVAGRNDDAEREACYMNQGEIELQAQLWRRATGAFPSASLGTIGADSAYFPDGLPTCPVDGTAYTIDASTGRVVGHDH